MFGRGYFFMDGYLGERLGNKGIKNKFLLKFLFRVRVVDTLGS